MNKMKKFHLVHTFFKCGLRCLIFGQELPQKLKKLTQERAQKQGARFYAMCVHASLCRVPNNFKQLGRPNFTYTEGLVKFGLHLDMLWIHEKSVTFVTWTHANTRTQLNFILDKSKFKPYRNQIESERYFLEQLPT